MDAQGHLANGRRQGGLQRPPSSRQGARKLRPAPQLPERGALQVRRRRCRRQLLVGCSHGLRHRPPWHACGGQRQLQVVCGRHLCVCCGA